MPLVLFGLFIYFNFKASSALFFLLVSASLSFSSSYLELNYLIFSSNSALAYSGSSL
nr:MAG TPA: hypothetical protein [Crassvirales sp.]